MTRNDKWVASNSDNASAVLIYVTYPDAAAAEAAARDLVEQRLAGCVNILPAMIAIYRWNGETQRSPEAVLLAKTFSHLVDAVTAVIQGRHPYATPAILTIPLANVSTSYLAWIASAVGTPLCDLTPDTSAGSINTAE